MSIHYTMTGERYETDRDGTVFHPSDDRGICDGCGDDLDDGSKWFSMEGWLCAACIDELEGDDDDESL